MAPNCPGLYYQLAALHGLWKQCTHASSSRDFKRCLATLALLWSSAPGRAGKTTFVQKVIKKRHTYLTLDDRTTLDAARTNPGGFVRELDYAAIDEIQRAPELLLAIKKSIDEDGRPGRFLLTGSANVLTLPRDADSLAGRMEAIHLLPLARAEILGRPPTFLESVFAGALSGQKKLALGSDLVELVLTGGFPEILEHTTERRRHDWGRSYLRSVLTRDLPDIADVERLTALPRFVRLLAEPSAQLVNYSEFGSGIDVSHKTSQRYVGLLEQVFLVSTLQPWHTNRIKRVIKTPKLHFLDTGLLASTRGLTSERIKVQRSLFVPVLETFVFAEITKLMSWSRLQLTPYHFRDTHAHEVDIVLERDDGHVVGVEVKANATVQSGDFSGIKRLADACGNKFAFGVVLYDGNQVVPFGDRLAAAPISCLWN